MALDGEKLRRIRMSKGISQEKLALMCNVNKRTIQRAEKGNAIALETAAFIAEAVGTTPASLRSAQKELFEPENKAWNEVILVPISSGRRIVDTMRNSFETELTFDVEPSSENVDALARLAALLEPFKPNPWANPDQQYDPTYAETLQKQAEINELLAVLSTLTISVFAATYKSQRQYPNYDHYEGHMYVTDHTPYRDADIAIVVVSDASASHLVRRPTDIYPDVDDDIPF